MTVRHFETAGLSLPRLNNISTSTTCFWSSCLGVHLTQPSRGNACWSSRAPFVYPHHLRVIFLVYLFGNGGRREETVRAEEKKHTGIGANERDLLVFEIGTSVPFEW